MSEECKHVLIKPLEGYTICEKCGETWIDRARRFEVGLVRFAPFGSGMITEPDRPFDDFLGDLPLEFNRWVKYLEKSRKNDVKKAEEKAKHEPVEREEKRSALAWLRGKEDL